MNRLLTIWERQSQEQASGFNQEQRARQMWGKGGENPVNTSAPSPLMGKSPLRGYQLILRKRRAHSSQASECRNEYYEELGTAILILTQGISKMYVTHFDIQ